jgi:putative hydrolase of the HAD superfamily
MDKGLATPYLHPLAPLPTGIKPKGRLQSQIKCLLCDIYGTLFISASGDISTARRQNQQSALLDRLLDRYGLTDDADALLKRLHHTIQSFHAESRIQGADFPEVVIEAVWQKVLQIDEFQKLRCFAVEFEMIMNPVWPMPGVESLLARCRTNGIALGIISNAQFFTPYLFDWLLRATPADLGFDPELIWYSYEHGRAKPSPYLFLKARRQLELRSVAPGNVAYIGNDVRNDIAPAQRIGFQTILFAGDSRSLRLREDDPTCRNTVPDMVINALNQLERCLQ